MSVGESTGSNISLFPELSAEAANVAPGEYKVIAGTDSPVQFRPGEVDWDARGLGTPQLRGTHYRGQYFNGGVSHGLLSFLYHKLDAQGDLETTERCIVYEGLGYGEYPTHLGQAPTWYLIGPQVGTIDHETGAVVTMQDYDGEISAKHFSVACITDGPLGEPILANPAQQ